MIRTSSYNNWPTSLYRTISISGDKGKKVNYQGKYFQELAPKLSFWKVWHSNIGIIPEEENNRYYIEEYYKQVLSKLNPQEIYRQLNYQTLLCYEDNTEFCHRHIVAAWLELLLDEKVPECKIDANGITTLERPKYIKEYLEEVMKDNLNMRGFHSLRALYLFEQSELLELEADVLEKQTGKNYNDYRQAACFMRCDADMAEDEYREKKRLIKKKNGGKNER